MSQTLKKYSVTIYLLIAMGITWLCWIPTLIGMTRENYLLPITGNTPLLFQNGFVSPRHVLLAGIFQLAVYGPLIAALVATALESGRTGLTALWQRLTHWRIPGRWYLQVAGITLAIVALPVLLGAALGQIKFDWPGLWKFLPYLLPMFLIQILTSGLGEEPGWRGFLLPRLQARFPGESALWWLGLIWAIWHYPLTIYFTLPQIADAPAFLGLLTILLALAGQTMSLIGMTFLYAWLYNHTQSLPLLFVFHALSNTLPAIPLGTMQPIISLLIALMPWGIVIVLEKLLPRGEFPGIPPQSQNP